MYVHEVKSVTVMLNVKFVHLYFTFLLSPFTLSSAA